jgi:hypothetical protein
LESILEAYNEENVDEFTPKVNEEEFSILEEQKLLDVMREQRSIVESQVLDLRVILPSCGMFKVLNENGSTYILQPQSLNPNMKKVIDEEAIIGPHDSIDLLIPWDLGGSLHNPLMETNLRQVIKIMKETFERSLASNFKPR